MAEAVPPAVMTAAEYSEEVSKWLQQAYQWQLFAVGEFAKKKRDNFDLRIEL